MMIVRMAVQNPGPPCAQSLQSRQMHAVLSRYATIRARGPAGVGGLAAIEDGAGVIEEGLEGLVGGTEQRRVG
jgi:hypothetical protein